MSALTDFLQTYIDGLPDHSHAPEKIDLQRALDDHLTAENIKARSEGGPYTVDVSVYGPTPYDIGATLAGLGAEILAGRTNLARLRRSHASSNTTHSNGTRSKTEVRP